MDALKATLRAATGMLSILVSKNGLFEKPGERAQAPLPEVPKPKAKVAQIGGVLLFLSAFRLPSSCRR